MTTFDMWFLGVMYCFMGTGLFATTKSAPNETPIHFIAVFLLWPIILIVFCFMFLFTGSRVHD